MPRLRFRLPPADLEPAVEVGYWMEGDAGEPPTQHFPIGRSKWVVVLEGGWSITPCGAARPVRVPESYLVGHQHGVYTLRPVGATAALGVLFHPTTPHKLFGLDMATLYNGAIPAEQIGTPWLTHLVADVRVAESDAGRWEAVDAALRDALARVDDEPTSVDQAIDYVRGREGAVAIAEVAEAVGIGARTLERRFQREVGITPKRYARQVRFLALLARMNPAPVGAGPDWMWLMTGLGYYDQSHFCRDFAAFAGCPPSAFAQTTDPMVWDVLGNDQLMDRTA